MERERRQTKVPDHYQIPLICYPRKRKKFTKKVALSHAKYQPIPFPLKFIYESGVYAFYGGVTLREYNGTLATANSVLSQFLRCREIKVINNQGNKIINMAIDKNPDFPVCPWQFMVEKLQDSESPNMRRWGDMIKDYCLKFEEKLRVWSDKENFLKQYSEEYLENMNRESEQKAAEYLATFPCISFKASIKGSAMEINDIVFNEEYLNALGYSIETFAVAALNGDIPEFPADNTQAVKIFMENVYSLEKGECHTPEFESEMTLKKGYIRKINYKVHYLATYKDGVLGIDCVLMLTNKAMPSVKFSKNQQEYYLNKKFVKDAAAKEKEASKFLKKYYNTTMNLEYTNMDKVCQIKHLDEFTKQE